MSEIDQAKKMQQAIIDGRTAEYYESGYLISGHVRPFQQNTPLSEKEIAQQQHIDRILEKRSRTNKPD